MFSAPSLQPESERPALLSAVCVVGVVLALVALWVGLTGSVAQAVGPLYWPYLLVTCGGTIASAVGLWHLRRWAPWAYAATALIDNTVLLLMGEWHLLAAAVPAGVLALCVYYRKRLS